MSDWALSDPAQSILVAIVVTFVLANAAIGGAALLMRLLAVVLSLFGVDISQGE